MTVKRKQKKIVQYIPKEVAQKRGISQYVTLDPKRILIFKPPSSLQKELSTILESLSIIDSSKGPDFAERMLHGDLKRTQYDFKSHMNMEKIAVAKATKNIGWDTRFSFQDVTVEYYQLHRRLVLERFIIQLRASILNTLNDGIVRIGQKLGFEGRIQIEGFPTLTDIMEVQGLLESGSISFTQIFERIGY